MALAAIRMLARAGRQHRHRHRHKLKHSPVAPHCPAFTPMSPIFLAPNLLLRRVGQFGHGWCR